MKRWLNILIIALMGLLAAAALVVGFYLPHKIGTTATNISVIILVLMALVINKRLP